MVTETIRSLGSPGIQSDNFAVAHDVLFQEIGLDAIVPVEYVGADLIPEITGKVLLGSLRDGRLRVFSPIKVRFIVEGNHVIAEATELNEFGFGANPSEALVDLQRAISELYFTLEQEQKRLGVDLQKVWGTLQKKILKR